jgi:hypothetical protein
MGGNAGGVTKSLLSGIAVPHARPVPEVFPVAFNVVSWDGSAASVPMPVHQADRCGNLTHRDSARNFNPFMAMAAKTTIVQTAHAVELGAIQPDHVHTAGVFVQRVLHVPV